MSDQLIAYFTWSGHSEQLARQIQRETGGKLFHIEPLEPYPQSYVMTTTKAAKERHQNRQPELARYLDSIEAYDTVYLVYPNWWNGIPMAVHTFLKRYDFSGKQIRPLCTSRGSGMENSVQEIKSVCPGAGVDRGLLLPEQAVGAAGTEEQIRSWIAGTRQDRAGFHSFKKR